MNLPNILSVSRILLLIPIISFFVNGFFILSVLTFVIASITDYLDGYFARKKNLVSDLGAFLDLLADKIFVSIILIWMTFNFDSLIILISSILIISREISISYLRLFIISKSKNIAEVKSDLLGKYKTTFQMIALGFILISPLTSDLVFNFSLTLLFFSAVISWISFIKYLKKWIV
jgi:CDP-diacylglycerol--glycerol-3-phosphate 3-phosphatidyltransferase